ncbi:MAG: protein kinase [Planctomycetota bacterium]|nr:protein kinase [Planctomycetota bacterium]
MVRCQSCNKQFEENSQIAHCPSCGGLLTALDSESTFDFTCADNADNAVTIDVGFDSKTVDINETVEKTVAIGRDDSTIFSHGGTVESIATDHRPQKHDSESTISLGSLGLLPSLPVGSDATIDLDSKPVPDGTINFSVDNFSGSPGATIQLGNAGLTVRKSDSQHFGIGPFQGSTYTPKGGRTRVDERAAQGDAALATVSKRTLAKESDALDILADYQVIKKLGEGGMGVVYSAIQRNLDRTVAVKAIKPGKGVSDESRRKFFYEAQITGDLDHPNIVPIHDLGTNDDGTLFYSMKMVDGTPWLDVIQSKSREENIEILMKTCDAVAFAHSRNIIHRDLKPENVMLGSFGEVLVMDWGLAIDLSIEQKFGMSGTPAFMAPEMAAHETDKIGRCSDIYILGGILFQIVSGKPPHGGSTVRECLMWAMDNRIIETDIQDPLIDIARKAMETVPSDRYQSVVEFQDAIREYLSNAESIALTVRAEDLLVQSIANKDYQGFARAMFSMRDAIELWPENQNAIQGLKKVRLAYGTCAFQRADYDLCLETLDTTEPEEKNIYDSALELKKLNQQKEQRFKTLRRVLAGVIIFAGITLSIATLYARRQAQIARQQESYAKAATLAERAAKENEAEAKVAALQQKELAIKAAADEKAARQNEELAKQQAQADRDKAISAQAEERKAKEQESQARSLAVSAEKKAIQNAVIATRNARQALIGNFQSQLNLALAQNNQFDVSRSNQLLREITSIESQLSESSRSESSLTDESTAPSGPLLQNWAFRRIQLLNNSDLPINRFGGTVTALDFAPDRGLGFIGTSLGKLQVVQFDSKQLIAVPGKSIQFSDPIVSAGMAPDGSEILVCTQAANSHYSLHRWRLSEKTSQPIEVLGRRIIQKIAYSKDGKWIIGGINGGLWKWDRRSDPNLLNPTNIDFRGKLVSLQFIDGEGDSNQAFFTSTLPNGSVTCAKLNLVKDNVEIVPVPEIIASKVTTAAIVSKNNALILGLNDGNISVGPLSSSASSKEVGKDSRQVKAIPVSYTEIVKSNEFEIMLPKRHLTSVRSIEVFNDGAIATASDEPVVNVWASNASQTSITHRLNLVGLISNVATIAFLDRSDNICGVDDRGNLLVWNIPQQERRQKIVRRPVPSQVIGSSLHSPIYAFSLDQNGVVQKWSVLDGAPIGIADNAMGFSYYGHTPGAIVSDVAHAAGNRVVATVAKLGMQSMQYLDNSYPNASELCLWSLETRQMLFRKPLLTTGDCRITFAESDNVVIVTDSKRTFVIDTSDESLKEREVPFGTHIPVTNPSNSSLIALIAPTGALRLLDLKSPDSWNQDGYKYLDIAINSRSTPISAKWTADGRRLFMTFDDGKIARINWDGTALQNLVWSPTIDKLRISEQDRPWRHANIRIKTIDKIDNIELATRQPGAKFKSSGSTTLTVVQWSTNAATTSVIESREVERLQWFGKELTSTIDAAVLSGDLEAVYVPFAMLDDALGNLVVVDESGSFTITDAANVQSIWSLGRTRCRQVSSSASGNRWLTLHDNGVAMLCDIDASGVPKWIPLRHNLGTKLRGEISPDGRQIFFLAFGISSTNMSVFSIKDNYELQLDFSEENVSLAKWHPLSKSLVTINAQNQVKMIDDQWKATPVVSGAMDKHLGVSSRLSNIAFFRESWSSQSEAKWHLVVQVDNSESSKLCFMDLLGLNLDFAPMEFKSRIASIASSAQENVLAIGDVQGNLSIWFAAPSIDRAPRELFTLPGHRGSSIDLLQFTRDGMSLFSSDSARQNLFWKSRD